MKFHNEGIFCSDGRYDSPGHNAKYLTYTFLKHSIDKIFPVSVTQFTEFTSSDRMKKYGSQKALHEIEGKDIKTNNNR